jgi:hypothetical protein
MHLAAGRDAYQARFLSYSLIWEYGFGSFAGQQVAPECAVVANLSSARCPAYGVTGCAAAGAGKSVWATGWPVSRGSELGGNRIEACNKKCRCKVTIIPNRPPFLRIGFCLYFGFGYTGHASSLLRVSLVSRRQIGKGNRRCSPLSMNLMQP